MASTSSSPSSSFAASSGRSSGARKDTSIDVGVPGGPAVQLRLRGLGIGVAGGAGLRGGHAVAAGVLGDGVDADRAGRCPLCAARLRAGDIPAAQHQRDAAVRNAFGRVAVEQHGCDPTITRWLIAMASDVLANNPHGNPDPPSVPVEIGMVVEDAQTGYVGAVVRIEYGRMELEDRHGRSASRFRSAPGT